MVVRNASDGMDAPDLGQIQNKSLRRSPSPLIDWSQPREGVMRVFAVSLAAALFAAACPAHAFDPNVCSQLSLSPEMCQIAKYSEELEIGKQQYREYEQLYESRRRAQAEPRQQEMLETLKRIELNSRQRGQ
jgi:hypothetical protein